MSYTALFNQKLIRSSTVILLVFSFIGFTPVQTEWKAEQLDKANTGKNNATLTAAEKETIQYINLARMYPKLYLKIEVKNYKGTYANSSYKTSLEKHLETMKPAGALSVEQYLINNAHCFAEEIGTSGRDDHKRHKCKGTPTAECISFGITKGKDIAIDLLIDDGIPDLIHREICLDKAYTKVGVSMHDHTKWKICTVLDFDF